MVFRILFDNLLDDFLNAVKSSPIDQLEKIKKVEVPADYFQFYKSVSSVYSSKIEGEEIDFDSFFKHRFLHVEFQPDLTRKTDDLFAAYDFIDQHSLSLENVNKAHAILTANLLPLSQQGGYRNNPMYVINSADRIEYIAADAAMVEEELEKLFHDVNLLLNTQLSIHEVFYYASLLHLVFVKIHPYQDGNGRTARLLEKWFLIEKIGKEASAIQSEKNYFIHLEDYYKNIKKLGLEYDQLNYNAGLDFLLMTIHWLDQQ